MPMRSIACQIAAYHHGRREMRVGSGGARGLVFLRRQQFLELVGRLLPFRRRMPVKRAGHCAPAHITGEDALFVFRGVAVFRFKLFQRADGRDVVSCFFAKAALAYPVGFGDSEVARGLGLGFEVGDNSFIIRSHAST